MRSMRWTALAVLALLLAAAAAEVSPQARRVAGAWLLAGASDDGGETLRPPRKGYRLFLNADGTWSDDKGTIGHWRLDGPRLYRQVDDNGDVDARFWMLRDEDRELRLIFPNERGRPSERLEVYRRGE